MPSIRRSSIIYLLVLLGAALVAVFFLVDRSSYAMMQSRQKAETSRIENTFEQRRKEVEAKFDSDLLGEARALSSELRYKLLGPPIRRPGEDDGTRPRGGFGSTGRAPDDEVLEFRLRARTLLLDSFPPGWSTIAAIGLTAESPNRSIAWTAFEAPRAFLRLQEGIKKAFDDDEHPGYFQFHLIASDPSHHTHNVVSVRPGRFDHELPLDIAALEQNPKFDHAFDDIEIPGKGWYRRVILAAGGPGGPFPLTVNNPPPSALSNLTGLANPRPPGRRGPPEYRTRVVIHAARPLTQLTSALAADRLDRDEQTERVTDETRRELAGLRMWLAIIGASSLVAVGIGGWLIIGRTLKPMQSLSEAVSRVSEKDFRLAHDGTDLPVELAPIHGRITQTLDLLRRAFAREKQAVADISHELRTPIASLLATLDVTLRKPRSPEQYRITLDECRVITRQLGQLVERIMTLATLDAGRDRTSSVRIEAGELAESCAALIRPLAEANDLTLEQNIAIPLELDTDPDKLREVLMNLLHNAIEYNRPGGRIELNARKEADRIIFEVRDTGIGMTPDVREKIFERFYRADASRHAAGVHAGLGLAIVQEYLGPLSGTIEVETAPGEGSTFRIALSAAAQSEALDHPEHPLQPRSTLFSTEVPDDVHQPIGS